MAQKHTLERKVQYLKTDIGIVKQASKLDKNGTTQNYLTTNGT